MIMDNLPIVKFALFTGLFFVELSHFPLALYRVIITHHWWCLLRYLTVYGTCVDFIHG